MRRLIVASTVLVLGGGIVVTAAPASAASVCVGSRPGCFSSLRAAVEAAHAGDVIHIGRGRFAGGVTINKSVSLAGAGAGLTVISGGGPVLTLGRFGAPKEPTVTITGLTITGGVTRSSPVSVPFVGVVALGGGIDVPPAAKFTPGATVKITDSVIIGNRVAPTRARRLGPPCPDGRRCPFALAAGGGIDNWGALTLIRTAVIDNRVGAASGLSTVASDANAGGIMSWSTGTLTVLNSRVSGNRASAAAPNGRFADGGGVYANGRTLTIEDSRVSDNVARLDTVFPNGVETGAQSGGVHIGSGTSATIRNTTVTGNTASARNLVGDAVAFVSGINADGDLMLRNSSVSTNRVSAETPAGSGGSASADSGAIGIGDASRTTIGGVRLTGNTVSAVSSGGLAVASAGAIGTGSLHVATISDSLISGNSLHATSRTGSVMIQAAGINNGGVLQLRDTIVTKNTGTASGPTGLAQGGGIWNGAFGPPPATVHLALKDTVVTYNSLTGSPGVSVQGGGLFTKAPVVLKDSVITHNRPDQCYGC